jgi:ribosomal protein S18 acetylase RimI-like enzyme
VPQDFYVRDGRADDVGSCVTLAFIVSPDSDMERWQSSFLEDVEIPGRLLVVAERAGEVVGYGRVLRFERGPDAPADIAPSGYYLMGLIVHPGNRRVGVASALTRARLDWIAERADEAWYFANALNAASIALHAPFGFEEVTRSFFYPQVDFDRGEGVLFRLTFPARRRHQSGEGCSHGTHPSPAIGTLVYAGVSCAANSLTLTIPSCSSVRSRS